KCHYPAAFYTSLLNSQPMGFYSPNALIQDARRHGITVLPVCVNHSDWQARLEKAKDSDDFAIRLGLHMIAGLKENSGRELIRVRNSRGKWQDLDDFLMNSSLYRSDLTAIAAANALFDLGADRRSALWLAEAASFSPFIEDVSL